jgi:hypothetical protein
MASIVTIVVPAKFVSAAWWQKINPSWWFGNDYQQTVDEACWYHAEWPQWRRRLYWNYFRNPLQNFNAVVAGVQDRTFHVTGKPPVTTIQRDDLGEIGWQWCVLHGGDLWVPRPFLSYSGKRIVWYCGWKPMGVFGIKFNLTDGIYRRKNA